MPPSRTLIGNIWKFWRYIEEVSGTGTVNGAIDGLVKAWGLPIAVRDTTVA